MNFDAAQKKKFMNKLFYGLPPFDQFVAKGDLEETEEIFFSRKEVMKRISNQINNNAQNSLLIPIVGETGNGKTHFLWGIKNTFNIDAFTTFIALPRSKDKFHYYVYSDFLEEFAATHLREFTQNFGDRFGANERLFGFFRTHNTVKVFINAYESLKEEFRYKTALEQCVSVSISHLMNAEKFQIAERWLLGELMEFDDLFILNVNEDLSGKFMAETMLKLLINNYNPGILLLFDDFEKASHEYSSLGTSYSDDYFDDDLDDESDNDEEDETLIEKIANLLIHTNNFKIVISMGFKDAEKILSEFKEKLGDKRLMADPISLTTISLNDVYQLYLERMKKFCYENKAYHPVIEFSLIDASRDKSEIPDILFFPLTKDIIEHIYEVSGGNTRRILKNFKRIFDALIFEEIKVENLNSDYNNYISTF